MLHESRGFGDPGDLNVCPKHVDEEFVASELADRSDQETPCSFCKGAEVDATPVEFLCELIAGAIHKGWETANDAGVWFEDGGYVDPVTDTWELVDEMLFEAGVEEPELIEAVQGAFHDEAWVGRYSNWLSPREAMDRGWKRFCDHVKHRSRFLLELAEDNEEDWWDESIPPRMMLQRLAKVVLDLDLLVTLDKGAELYRARSYESRPYVAARDLASTPTGLASQGRMNPAGISMFYGADDPVTAAVEVYRSQPNATVGCFQTLRDIEIVDFTTLPSSSVFDSRVSNEQMYMESFLRSFVQGISRPYIQDGRIHREYVPTQIMTEYLRYRLLPTPAAIDGIAFPSSKTGGRNVVLFVGHSGCLTQKELGRNRKREEERVLSFVHDRSRIYSFGPPQASESARLPTAAELKPGRRP